MLKRCLAKYKEVCTIFPENRSNGGGSQRNEKCKHFMPKKSDLTWIAVKICIYLCILKKNYYSIVSSDF